MDKGASPTATGLSCSASSPASRVSPVPASIPSAWDLPLVARLTARDGCPFCGRDPYHYVDIGLGMQPVAVNCCDLGNALIQHRDEQLMAEMDLRGEAAHLIVELLGALENVPLPSTMANAQEFYGRFYDWLHGPYETVVHKARNAQGTETGAAETEGLGPKDDGPVPEGDAPND
jgi:hypothetical protein